MADFEILLSGSDVRAFDTPPYLDTPICVRANGRYFPDGLWTDFSFEVLSMWTEEFQRNRWGVRPKYTFQFMEGPFRMIGQQNGDELHLSGINARWANDIVEFEIRIPVAEFLGELLRAFQKLQRIVYTTDAFRDERTRENALESIRHYTKLLEEMLARDYR